MAGGDPFKQFTSSRNLKYFTSQDFQNLSINNYENLSLALMSCATVPQYSLCLNPELTMSLGLTESQSVRTRCRVTTLTSDPDDHESSR